MQYAAVLLASTYHRFGHAGLCLRATEEAVRVAQQGDDEEAARFAGAWAVAARASLGGGRGGGAGEAALRRAGATGAASLAARAALELARRTVYRRGGGARGGALGPEEDDDDGGGGGEEPSAAWEVARGAGRTAVPSSAGGAASGAAGGGIRGGGAVLPPSASSSFSGSDAVRAAAARAPADVHGLDPDEVSALHDLRNVAVAGLWESTGHASSSALSARAALRGQRGGGRATFSAATASRVLASFATGPGIDVWTDARRGGEGSGGGLEDGAVVVRGESYAWILEGVAALSKAEGGRCGRCASSSERTPFAAATTHEWCVRSNDLSLARSLRATTLANYAALPPGGATAATEASLAYLAQSAQAFLRSRDYDRATAAARRACLLAGRHGLAHHRGQSLLQLALIGLEVPSDPTSTASWALPPLLECLDLAERYAMDPLRAAALSTLARTFLRVGRHRKAQAALRAAMPLVMQHGHAWFQGEAFLTLAKCRLAEASCCRGREAWWRSNTGGGGPSRGERKRDRLPKDRDVAAELHEAALVDLQNAADHFEKIEDLDLLREVYYLEAQVCHSLPHTQKRRDEAAWKFMNVSAERRRRPRKPVLAAGRAGGTWSL
ncbi:hypothetical protein ACHAWF_010068 [Thalassiosira exigua]